MDTSWLAMADENTRQQGGNAHSFPLWIDNQQNNDSKVTIKYKVRCYSAGKRSGRKHPPSAAFSVSFGVWWLQLIGKLFTDL